MLALFLYLAVSQAPVGKIVGSRDLATIPAPGAADASADLDAVPDAELAKRIARLRVENRASFSDRRAMLLERLMEEQERRRHDREWEADEQRRRAVVEAETARQEAAFQAAEVKRAEALAAEQRMVAAAKVQAARDAELAAEERAIEERQARTRWLALGALAAAVVGGGAWTLARRRSG